MSGIQSTDVAICAEPAPDAKAGGDRLGTEMNAAKHFLVKSFTHPRMLSFQGCEAPCYPGTQGARMWHSASVDPMNRCRHLPNCRH